MVYLWRAVDAEGEIFDVLVQSKRNKNAALKLMRKLLKKYAFVGSVADLAGGGIPGIWTPVG
jgi:transposase-like protein